MSYLAFKLFETHVEQFNSDLRAYRRGHQLAIESILPGWSPLSVLIVKHHLHILVLGDTKKKSAFWYFNRDGYFIGNSAKTLCTGYRLEVRNAFSILFRRFLSECVDPQQHELRLTPLALEPFTVEFSAVVADLFADATDVTGNQDTLEGVVLNALPGMFQDDILKRADSEIHYKWRGLHLRASRAIVISDYVLAYPLFCGRSLNSLLFVGSHTGTPLAFIYIDRMGIFIKRVGGVKISALLSSLIFHLNSEWSRLRRYFSESKPTVIFGVTRSGHIGHRLWNDLSGLYRVRQSGSGTHLRGLIHFDKQNVGELWMCARALLERPDLDVVIAGGPDSDIAGWVYENNILPLRIADSYIPIGLVKLVASLCTARADVMVPPKVLHELRIVFGLRFENRTWINQTKGLAELACHLAERFPKLTIVIDGHDRIDGKKAASHGEQMATADLVTLEKCVVQSVKDALVDNGYGARVTVVDAVDMELSTTMAWILSADCFVAPWGAGLAKYKWIANLDGVIFSSREVIETKADLKIYENPKVREGATECIYLPVRYVNDQPEASTPINIPGGEGLRANFIVDMTGLKMATDQMLDKISGNQE
jgi:hypothetical protein